jgi:hypothetical protein
MDAKRPADSSKLKAQGSKLPGEIRFAPFLRKI